MINSILSFRYIKNKIVKRLRYPIYVRTRFSKFKYPIFKVYLSIKYSDINLMLFRVQEDFAREIFKNVIT